MEPAFVRIMWLPFWRRITHPLRSKARRASEPETRGSSANRDVHFDRPDGQRESLLCANLETPDDGFADVGKGFLLGVTLADAARDGRTLGDNHTSLVSFKDHRKLHGSYRTAYGGQLPADEDPGGRSPQRAHLTA